MIRCTQCCTRYTFSGARWYEFRMPKKEVAKEFCAVVYDEAAKLSEKVFELPETMGQWMKRHGIKREKRARKQPMKASVEIFSTPRTKSVDIENRIRHRWAEPLSALCCKKRFVFGKNVHFGKLRGRDAAKICHRDLKRIGISTRLKFTKNYSGTLEMIE
jgi:hypothetical protein